MLLYWISRMVMATHRGAMRDAPVLCAAKDRTSLVCLLVIPAMALGGKLF